MWHNLVVRPGSYGPLRLQSLTCKGEVAHEADGATVGLGSQPCPNLSSPECPTRGLPQGGKPAKRLACLCVGQRTIEVVPAGSHAAVLQRAEQLSVTLGDTVVCRSRYQGHVLGIEASASLDCAHDLSAGAVSFARGLNDTPKIAALLLVAPLFGSVGSALVVALPMALGGVLSARRVADVMSQRITPMNHGQGFVANLVTSAIVIGASRFGMPVSTTHVSCGALFGIGTVTRQGRLRMIAAILSAWVTTLPVAALLGAIAFRVLVSM